MARFSKLQKKIYNLFDEKLIGRVQFHETVYDYPSQCTSIPAIRIDLDGELLYEWPKDISYDLNYNNGKNYWFSSDITYINNAIDDYINCPKNELFTRDFNDYETGLISIIRACDRRVGKRQNAKYVAEIVEGNKKSSAIIKILKIRGFDDFKGL